MEKVNKYLSLSLLALVFVLFSGTAKAQSDEISQAESGMPTMNTTTTATTKKTSKVKERKAILNFEDELVEGSTSKPELFYLFQKKNFNYNRLIKLRENFLPEMRTTTEHVQRVRGGN
ncbi:MAG: hypothetical protein V4736_01480 [Bdellovibrionota bacterium]